MSQPGGRAMEQWDTPPKGSVHKLWALKRNTTEIWQKGRGVSRKICPPAMLKPSHQ